MLTVDALAVRGIIAEGLEAGAVGIINEIRVREAFFAGTWDIRIADLDMDSLARMELSMAIEIALGVSLAASDFDRYATLGELVDMLVERTNA
ncbi:acyl carrier protein [Burkholderiales bacterium]|nr:acyl carrier protein [Burkholderiales bacterium]